MRFAYPGYGGSIRQEEEGSTRKVERHSMRSEEVVDLVARVRPTAAPGGHVATASGTPGALASCYWHK